MLSACFGYFPGIFIRCRILCVTLVTESVLYFHAGRIKLIPGITLMPGGDATCPVEI